MKPLLGCSVVSLTLLLLLHFGLNSCSKGHTIDHTVYDTVKVTITAHDTTVIKDTAVSFQLLTANSWKIKEIRGVLANNAYYYLRGGTNTGINYDNESITFNANKTGSYVDPNGYSSVMTSWDFVGNDSTKIVFVIAFPTVTTTLHWENMRYKNGALYYDEYYTQNGNNCHEHGVRIPRGY